MRRHVLLLALACFIMKADAVDAWDPDGSPVCTESNDQTDPVALGDGAGGVSIVWHDVRSGTFQDDIYLQKLDALGVPQFTVNGVPVCTAVNVQLYAKMISDGAGGVIVAWEDRRDATGPATEIYAQRMDASGSPQWAANGVGLPLVSGDQTRPAITSDGAGGAIVAWVDNRLGLCRTRDIYARRIDSRGTPMWASTGVPVCTSIDDQDDVQIASDGAGGAFVVWSDKRSEVRDAYAQRLDADGVIQWAPNGVVISSAPDRQKDLAAVSGAPGGLMAIWNDWRTGSPAVYAQKVDPAGVPNWTPNGVIAGSPSSQSPPTVVADANGYVVAHEHNSDVYVQRFDLNGTPLWGPDGVALCTAAGTQRNATVVSDGSGGAIVTWVDFRNGNGDIYARRIDGAGVPQWVSDGVPLCTAGGDQERPTIVSDGASGAIVVWDDPRNGARDIYAQHVTSDGLVGSTTGVPAPVGAVFRMDPPRPNPASGPVTLEFELAVAGPVEVLVFDATGRTVRRLVNDVTLSAGPHALVWDGRDARGRLAPSGVYLARVHASGTNRTVRIQLSR